MVYRIGRRSAGDEVAEALRWRRHWLSLIPARLGICAELNGTVPQADRPVIYVCNHRSYIDPVIISMFVDAVVIAKHEVSGWPLIGTGAKMAGVIFVNREDKDSRSATLDKMLEMLNRGFSILVYPEGTTTAAPELLPFRPGAFHLAAANNVPLIPVAIEFEDPSDAWIGTDTFIRHFFQAFGKKRIVAHVAFGPAICSDNGDIMLHEAYTWIGKQLPLLRA